MFLAEIDDLRALLFWLVFVLLPVLGRVMGWIATKLSSTTNREAPPRRKPPRPEAPSSTSSTASPRFESSTGTPTGERSLYASFEEEAEREPEVREPEPRPTAQVAGTPTSKVPDRGHAADRVEVHREYEAELSTLLDVGPGASSLAETSFGTAARFAAFDRELAERSIGGDFDVLDAPSNVKRVRRVSEPGSAAVQASERPSLTFDRRSVRNAIVWAEILGPPVSLRDWES